MSAYNLDLMLEVPAGFLLHALAAGMTQEEIDLAGRLAGNALYLRNLHLCWSPQTLRVDRDHIMPSRRAPVMGFQASHLALIHWSDLMEMRWAHRPIVLRGAEGWRTEPFIAERL